MKKYLPGLAMLGVLVTTAQNVNIPDANFKAALVGNTSINTNSDSEIQLTEAAAYSGAVNVTGLNISNLTGIETFTAITSIDCSYNNLTSINISSNTALGSLMCNNNNLTSISISANTGLSTFDCSVNQLTALDLSTNSMLTILGCNNNNLTGLNTAANPSLTILVCGFNHLSTLNVSSNTALASLDCESNQLASLTIAGNTSLVTLNCSSNSLASLNISSISTLKYLNCQVNQLINLDASANTSLRELRCYSNQLTSLNLQNGNNSNLTFFSATNNPSLTCIQVDNVSYMNANWPSGKDAGANFSTNCQAGSIESVESPGVINIFPNPSAGIFTVQHKGQAFSKLTVRDILGNCIWARPWQGQSQQIDLRDKPEGIYFVELMEGQKKIVKKLVVN